MQRHFEFTIGVDEVGRGPLAGPVAVGVVKIPTGFDWTLLPGVRDSKQVGEAEREQIAKQAAVLKRAGVINFAVGTITAQIIDTKGIVFAIKRAQAQAFRTLSLVPENCFVKLDGSLSAPAEFAQETIIKGDQKELSIALASIIAKVKRDRYMKRISELYPGYDFAVHKGYGTKKHRVAIANHGLSPLHRTTYCKNIISLYS